MTDQELLECFLGGDKECFGIVYERFRSPFIKTAMYQYGLVREDAEDIVQEFFLKAFQSFEKYDSDKGTIKDYMEVSFKNFTIDFIRKEKKKGYQEELEDFHLIEEDVDDMVEYRSVLKMHVDRVVKEEPQRTIFDKYLGGTPISTLYEEYSEVMPPFILKNFISNSLRAIRHAAKKQI